MYVGANGTYTSIVKCLTIRLHDERLKDMQIVDTPGVNDPVISREQRTRDFLRECHGVFFLSYSGRFFDSTDVTFLTDRIGSQGIGEVVLIGSKFDSVLQDVGMKYKDDLGSALDYCQRALKKQYATNIAASNFQGKDPVLDFSSGIGYSIAEKDESKWDDMERHVVKQMKTFYPSFFSNVQDIRETFLNLSQIEDIRKKYVDDTFKSRKDEIIQSKINAYFSNSCANLKEILSKEKQQLKNKVDLLRQSDIEGIENQQHALETVIKHIKNDLSSIASRMDETAQKYQKECLNEYTFNWNGSLPTHSITATFQRKGTFWGGTKNFQHDYESVDLNKLINDVCNNYDRALNALDGNWKKNNENIKKNILNKINQIITESEENDKSGHLDTRILRNILDEAVDAMGNRSTLDLAHSKTDFKNKLTNILMGMDAVNTIIGECSEMEAKSMVEKASREAKIRIINAINNCITSTQSDIKGMLEKAREASIEVLGAKKNEFIRSVENSTNEVLTNLKNDLKNKKENLQVMETTFKELTKIENEL